MAFLCECETFKLKNLKAAFGDKVNLIFTDMKELANGSAHDFVSGRNVPVPKVSQLSNRSEKAVPLVCCFCFCFCFCESTFLI